MEASDLKIYLERWKAVEVVEKNELLAASIEDRWQQLNTIYGLGLALGLVSEATTEKEVWQCWAVLRDLE